ncbi:protein LplB [Thermoclostridium stercorarium subsp. stercorarium DSM 8532]|jgi:putative aldouronate transport system permease protein|uniref:Protein LplB n=3 Tax=Thermoclostridium stercorarium TaxID=1510 RepID=L7VLT4_THES1|nr:ABC transporter permease subunit [Thermoclostridium stercorarium]AGC67476.1 protein LplB [Thermoclostridium stercorarium subsp. stercorarium DSM 8532]AGI38532.1 ABC transporter permease subunit [Thermoclostridium stercorarium subsp. stercorarium DSM 8532]ANW97905.1 sugar ABC transporter permease [Thermoclostridium stercorarium subsp. thermolacticum DSM 2910]ANX00456.1 sugar ABC transporter permease [Thermoclostridium stercorarium subsp. leptospartum DSM 9219]
MKAVIKEIKKKKILFLMLMPAFIHVFIFSYLPMAGAILAFKRFQYNLGIFKSPWAGFSNFRFFFISGDAFRVTVNTLMYNLIFITVNNFLEISFAIILSELSGRIFKKITQSVMFLPYFISWVIAGVIVYNFFNYEFGVFNGIRRALGLEPVDVYNSANWWRVLLVFFSAWKNVGYGTIIYLSAIMGIEQEMFDAAEIDGANLYQRIRHIMLPSLVPTMVMLLLLAVSNIFRGDFGLFYQLVGTNPLVYDATDIIDTYVFRSLMTSSDIGMAAAAGLYQSVMCFITILVVNKIVKSVHSDYALF